MANQLQVWKLFQKKVMQERIKTRRKNVNKMESLSYLYIEVKPLLHRTLCVEIIMNDALMTKTQPVTWKQIFLHQLPMVLKTTGGAVARNTEVESSAAEIWCPVWFGVNIKLDIGLFTAFNYWRINGGTCSHLFHCIIKRLEVELLWKFIWNKNGEGPFEKHYFHSENTLSFNNPSYIKLVRCREICRCSQCLWTGLVCRVFWFSVHRHPTSAI